MAETTTSTDPTLLIPIPSSISSDQNPNYDDDLSSFATISGREDTENKEPEAAREHKRRRKNCPSALENCEAIKGSSADSMFSFSFDTKVGCTPEFTPKFGSFNLTAGIDSCGRIPVDSPERETKDSTAVGVELISPPIEAKIEEEEEPEEADELKKGISGEAEGELTEAKLAEEGGGGGGGAALEEELSG